MTGNSDKLRSLFLAALMVFSVFAGTVAMTGSVAAASNNPTLEKATHYTDNDGNPIIELAFNESIDSSGDVGSVTVGFEDGSEASIPSANITRDSNNNARVIVNTSSFFNNARNVTVDGFESSGSETVDVTVAPATATLGNPGTDKIEYVGSNIAIEAGSTDETVQINRPGGSTTVRGTGSASEVYVYNTDGLSTGTYTFNNTDASPETSAVVRLQSLGLTVEADDTSVFTDENITATVTADNINRPITAELLDSDGDTVETVNTQIDADGEVTVDLGQASAGNYTVEVTDDNTGVTASSDTISVSEAPDVDTAFASRSYSVTRGDLAEIDITMAEGATATLGVGGAGEGYNANISVRDADDDGEVTITWNSFKAGSGSEFTVSDDDARVDSNVAATSIGGNQSSVIQTGRYDLNLVNGDEAQDLPVDESVSRARISVNERSTGDLVAWTAPAATNVGNLDLEAVQGAVGDTITQDSTVALTDGSSDDLLVLQLESSGLEGYVGTRAGSGATAFFNAGDISVTATQLNPGPNQSPNSFELEDGNVTLIPDFDNGTHYLAVDTSDLQDNEGVEMGQQYDFTFQLAANSTTDFNYGLIAPEDGEFSNETATASTSFVEGTVSINTNQNDQVVVSAAANQTVAGSSSFADGTELSTLEATSNDDAISPYVIPSQDTVTIRNGQWNGTLNFSDEEQNAGTTFDLTASANGVSTTASGTIQGEPVVNSLNFSDQTSNGNVVVVDEVNMSAGGFVAIHVVDNGSFGAVIGHSNYLAGNTVHEDVAIVLDEPISENQDLIAMPHLDTDGDQVYEFGQAEGLDAPYTQNGTPVTDTAAISGLGGGATATPGETPTPTEQEPTPTPTEQEPTPTPTEQEPTETPTEEATETPGDSGPGFGIVVSVLALLAAALLAARRNE